MQARAELVLFIEFLTGAIQYPAILVPQLDNWKESTGTDRQGGRATTYRVNVSYIYIYIYIYKGRGSKDAIPPPPPPSYQTPGLARQVPTPHQDLKKK